ncbi:hypothetical protein PV797_03025 [Clostridiaceae bacterium M8S5]|nr:hypothetical protein PV797_03025 [Clostridiaceae bacterium M8S5]
MKKLTKKISYVDTFMPKDFCPCDCPSEFSAVYTGRADFGNGPYIQI